MLLRRPLFATFLLFIVAVAAGSTQRSAQAEPVATVPVDLTKPIRIDTSAAPRFPERSKAWVLGWDHGRKLKPQIHAAFAHAKRLFVSNDEAQLEAELAKASTWQAHFPATLIEEMRGIAAGSGLAFDRVLFLNVVAETKPAALHPLFSRAHASLAAPATSAGQLLHGAVLRVPAGMQSLLVALVLEPADAPPFVSITLPGHVGSLAALGAQGVASSVRALSREPHVPAPGRPVALRVRESASRGADLPSAAASWRFGEGPTSGIVPMLSSGITLTHRALGGGAPPSDSNPRGVLGYGAGIAPSLWTRTMTERGSLRERELREWLARDGTERSKTAVGELRGVIFEPQMQTFSLGRRVLNEGTAPAVRWTKFALGDFLSATSRAKFGIPVPVATTGKVTVKQLKARMAGVDVKEIRFDSPVPCGHETCDQVVAQLWSPPEPIGVVIQLPAWKERTLAGHQVIATALATKHKIATLILPLPGQADRREAGSKPGARTLSANLARTRQSFVQGLADIKRMSLWLETQGFPPAKQAVSGVSLGGHAAAIAFGHYPERFKAGVFMLAGANVADVFAKWNPITGRIHKTLQARGVSRDEAARYVSVIEPSRNARPDRKADVLLIAADADEVVDPKNARALAKAYGDARIYWLEGGHYAILKSMLHVIREMSAHLTKAFEGR